MQQRLRSCCTAEGSNAALQDVAVPSLPPLLPILGRARWPSFYAAQNKTPLPRAMGQSLLLPLR